MRTKLSASLILTGLVLSACTFGGSSASPDSGSGKFNSREPVASEHYHEYDSDPAAFETALADGKPIFINFHANWCPTCWRQNPQINRLFGADESIRALGIEGFYANLLDNETSAEERALAERYGVSIQHTYLYINADGEVVKKTVGTRTEQQLRDDLAAIAQ